MVYNKGIPLSSWKNTIASNRKIFPHKSRKDSTDRPNEREHENITRMGRTERSDS